MHFETLQSISLNGTLHKPNDDRLGATANLAWVVDGATDMGEPGLLGAQGGAAWLATTASTSFAISDQSDMKSTCQSVFNRIEAQFENERTRESVAAWEVPKAAFSAVQLFDDHLEIAWAADCPILHISGEDVSWCTGEPDTSAEIADALALGPGIGAGDRISGKALENRREHRAQSGHVALSSCARNSECATRYSRISVAAGDELILMSDGFASLITDYEAYSATGFVTAVRSVGFAVLAQEIRAIENADAACLRFPRFKVSDDATAMWLRVVR